MDISITELPDFDHPRVDDACQTFTEKTGAGFFVRCTTHDYESDGRESTPTEAWMIFECDHGRRWSFIVTNVFSDGTNKPRMVDLSGLKAELRDSVENPDPHDGTIAVWRWQDGLCEVVDVDADETAEDKWECTAIAADTGREYLRFTMETE